MREIVRIELPASSHSSGGASNNFRGARGGRSVVRTKSGNIVSAPTPSNQPPSVSSSITTESCGGDDQRVFSPQFSSHSSSPDTVFMASSCDSNNNDPQQNINVIESMTTTPMSHHTSYNLRLDIPHQVINEVSDLEESNGAAYDSDDSLKDLNWLGGLNASRMSQSKTSSSAGTPSSSANKAKLLQSPRRNNNQLQTPVASNSAASPRNRALSAASSGSVMPYVKRPVLQAPTAGTALSPIRQSSPVQPHQPATVELMQLPQISITPQFSAPSTPASLITSSVPVSQMISQPPWITQQREARRLNRLKRPPFSYIALCCMALASSDTLTLPLAQLYKWIEDSFPYYARPECYQDWRSSIRHTLSLYSFFQSAPVMIGRKTIPTWRLDITEPERQEIGKLVGEYIRHQNSQFISEWTSRLVYAEQRSHRRGAYDRQASRFKAFSALRSRSSSTDTLTSTHSTSTNATGGYQSFTPDSGMSSITSASGPTHLTISEADISLLSGALTSITAATVNNASAPFPHHRRVSPAPVMICGNPPSIAPRSIQSSLAASPAPSCSSQATNSTTTYETGPGITIIRIPANAPKFNLLVLAPPAAQLMAQQQQQSIGAPVTPMSVASDQSNSALFDLTNQGYGMQMHQQYQYQSGQSPSMMSAGPPSISVSNASPVEAVNQQQMMVDYNNQMQQHWNKQQQDQIQQQQQVQYAQVEYQQQAEPIVQHYDQQQQTYQQQQYIVVDAAVNMAPPEPINSCSGVMVPNDVELVDDFGASMDLDLSLQDFTSTAEELFADAGNIDFAAMLDGALDTPRSVLLPPTDNGML